MTRALGQAVEQELKKVMPINSSAEHLVEQIINDAALRNASDIHFEVYRQHYRIRLRIDGLLSEIAAPT